MRFRSGAKLDPSQVTDVRGRGGMGGPVLAGGGGLGVVGLVIFVLYTVLSGGSGDLGGLGSLDGQSVSTGAPSTLGQDCQTGADANSRQDCRIVADVNSIQAYWNTAVRGYTPAKTVFYTDAVQTGCGAASSQVGPFYCPADKQVYIDLGFFDELQSRFGAEGGPFAEAYVLAHEYGHHIQDLLGTLEARPAGQRARGRVGANGAAGRLLCGGVGEPCRRDRADREPHAGRHQQRHRRGRSGRGRSHPGAYAGAGESRVLDARLVGATPAVVLEGLRDRPAVAVQHVRRLHLAWPTRFYWAASPASSNGRLAHANVVEYQPCSGCSVTPAPDEWTNQPLPT